MNASKPSQTPMFQQYHRIKADHQDAILMFRMGDFYEMFFEDAVQASPALEITLTARGGGATEIPMCGVPVHAADGYIARLVQKGFRVAICEQVEDPKKAKGLVRREVVRVVSPGTMTDPDHLDVKENNYLAALWGDADAIGAAYLDLSTGEFRLAEIEGERRWEALRDQLAAFRPREVLAAEESAWETQIAASLPAGTLLQHRPGWNFELETARRSLVDQMGAVSLDGFGVVGRDRAVRAAGGLLQYLRDTQKTDLAHVNRLHLHEDSRYLLLDAATLRSLEIVRSTEGRRAGSLLGVVDATRTAMGARMLNSWLARPSRELPVIEARHEAVAELVGLGSDRAALSEPLSGVRDLERLLCRATLGTATPRVLGGLRDSLVQLPEVHRKLQELRAPLLAELAAGFDDRGISAPISPEPWKIDLRSAPGREG